MISNYNSYSAMSMSTKNANYKRFKAMRHNSKSLSAYVFLFKSIISTRMYIPNELIPNLFAPDVARVVNKQDNITIRLFVFSRIFMSRTMYDYCPSWNCSPI